MNDNNDGHGNKNPTDQPEWTEQEERDLAHLLMSAPEIAPSTASRSAMKATLMARVAGDLAMPHGASTVRAAQGEWHRFDDFIEVKVLHRDEKKDCQTALWRLKPGAIFPAHPHEVDEECLVLEGEIVFGEHPLFVGDFHFMRAGHKHPVARSKSGCLLLIRAESVKPPGKIGSALLAAHHWWHRPR